MYRFGRRSLEETAEAQVNVKVTGDWRLFRGNRGALTDLAVTVCYSFDETKVLTCGYSIRLHLVDISQVFACRSETVSVTG